jgi:hypothetical protein
MNREWLFWLTQAVIGVTTLATTGCGAGDECQEAPPSLVMRIESGLKPDLSLRFVRAVEGDLYPNLFVSADVQGPRFASDNDLATWMILPWGTMQNVTGTILADEGLAKDVSNFDSWERMDAAFFYSHDGKGRLFAEVSKDCVRSVR